MKSCGGGERWKEKKMRVFKSKDFLGKLQEQST